MGLIVTLVLVVIGLKILHNIIESAVCGGVDRALRKNRDWLCGDE